MFSCLKATSNQISSSTIKVCINISTNESEVTSSIVASGCDVVGLRLSVNLFPVVNLNAHRHVGVSFPDRRPGCASSGRRDDGRSTAVFTWCSWRKTLTCTLAEISLVSGDHVRTCSAFSMNIRTSQAPKTRDRDQIRGENDSTHVSTETWSHGGFTPPPTSRHFNFWSETWKNGIVTSDWEAP